MPGVEVFVEPVKEHRFVVVLRGDGLGGDVHDTDPQVTGVPPLDPVAHDPASETHGRSGGEVHRRKPGKLLAGEKKANGLTLRGFSAKPALPSYEEVYGLRAAAIAVYPMYKGLARLVGMKIVGQAQTLAEQMAVLRRALERFRFLLHPLQIHRLDRRGRQLRRQGETDRRTRRRDARDHGLEADGADRHRRPQHAELFEEPQLASRADAAWSPTVAAPTAAASSAKRRRCAAAWGNSRRST